MELDRQTNELNERNRPFSGDRHDAIALLDEKPPDLIEIEFLCLDVSVYEHKLVQLNVLVLVQLMGKLIGLAEGFYVCGVK